jgi:hypothetical protein
MTPKDSQQWQAFTTQQTKDIFNMAPSRGREWERQILRFCIGWADAMEQRMSRGEAVAGCAEVTSYEIDEAVTEGLTLLMYQYCVGVLVRYWAYGEQLRVWHNRRFVLEADDSCCGDCLIDCCSIHTIMGKIMLVALYRDVMKHEGGYKAVIDKALAALFLSALEAHYDKLGVRA